MNKLILLAGVALLASCGAKEEAAAPEGAASDAAPAEAAAAPAAPGGPGVYDVTRPDGTKLVSTIKEDGTFERDYGDRVEKGTWVAKGDQTCFVLEGETAESCRTRGPAAADGSFESTEPDGSVSKVVPRS